MKTLSALKILPKRKRREVTRIIEIFKESKLVIQMLILFGSHARGDWVEDSGVAADGSRYDYTSDYDLLVIVENHKEMVRTEEWKELEEALNEAEFTAPISLIRHTINQVNEQITIGHYFFLDILNEGIVLYNRKQLELADPNPLSPEEHLEVIQEYYGHWFQRAFLFLRNYAFSMETGDYNTAAFCLHQVTESLLACLLLVKTGYKPKSHNLVSLEMIAVQKIPEFRPVFPKKTEEQRNLLELLKSAYIDARYTMHFQVRKEDLLWLETHVLRLKEIVREISKNEGIVTELLDPIPTDKTTEEFLTELEASWEESGKKELATKTIRAYRDEAFQQGQQTGLEKGKAEGFHLGKEEGKTEGYQLGEQSGIEKGKTEGLLIGKAMGKQEGFRLGEKNGVEKGKTQGYKLGKEEGEKQKTLQMAKAMKAKGVDPQLIAEVSGLPLETIEAL